ncbi:TrbC/VirB2 family protein [Campylobacter sp.]|uniref:TrbC/VirB2 family protein n=1 Tax=Campylobacter sp. TaxID=205 RepID=UPI0025BADAAC|nr:TrbC/VirB2 family protein [Campylobacter sp.]
MKKFLILFLVAGISIAWASTTGAGLPWESPLQTIKASITGPVAFVVSILAMVGAGVGLVFGAEFNGFIKTLLSIVLAVSIVIGATNFISIFNTSGALI